MVLMHLGTIMSSNYLYLNPLFTTLAAFVVLNETLTIYAFIGVLLVMLGVFYLQGTNKREAFTDISNRNLFVT